MSSLETAAAAGALEKTREMSTNTLRRAGSFMYLSVGAPSVKEISDRPLKCQSIFDGIYDVESFEGQVGTGNANKTMNKSSTEMVIGQ